MSFLLLSLSVQPLAGQDAVVAFVVLIRSGKPELCCFLMFCLAKNYILYPQSPRVDFYKNLHL
jgi:hypothetical protein